MSELWGRRFYDRKSRAWKEFFSNKNRKHPVLRQQAIIWGEKTVIGANATHMRSICYTGEWFLVAPVCQQTVPTHSK